MVVVYILSMLECYVKLIYWYSWCIYVMVVVIMILYKYDSMIKLKVFVIKVMGCVVLRLLWKVLVIVYLIYYRVERILF